MAKIQGRVVGVQGAPLNDVLLTFTGKLSQDKDELETDAEGRFLTKTMKADDYTWTAQLERFGTRTGVVVGVLSGSTVVDIEPIVLELAAQVVGRVTAADGSALSGVIVVALDANQQQVAQSLTSNDGVYSLATLASGTYTIVVQAPAGFQSPQAREVSVAAGQEVGDISFQLAAITPTGPTPTGPVPTGPTPTGPVPTGPTPTGPTPTGPTPTGPTPTGPVGGS